MKIGIFGGSFDPVHLGHLFLAADALKAAELDRVYFVPVKVQPFKQDRHAASGQDRINMLEIGFSYLPNPEKYEVSRYELDNDGVSYTYLTLRAFRDRFPDADIYFILGEDSLLKIETWAESEEILKGCSLIVGQRPGYDNAEMLETIERIRANYGTEIVLIKNRLFDISSTHIRDRVYDEDLPDELVPEKVEEYIEKHGIYR
jgi:nicotinate-nucleotide adenylyltransferase